MSSVAGAIAFAWAVLCVGVAAPCAAQLEPEFAATLGHDSNVTRAPLREDVRADIALEVRAALDWHAVSHDGDILSADVALRGRRYARFEGLSSLAVEIGAAWRRKLGVGLTAPWLAASIDFGRDDFRDDTRDSDRLELRLSTGRRWSAALDTSAGYAFDRRFAHRREPLVPGVSGAVWDVRGHTLFARVGYALGERWLADLGYAARHGDVVATTRQHADIFRASDAIAESESFDGDFYDYRLRGTTHAVNAILSYAAGAHATVDLGYGFALTRAAHGLDYRNHLWTATWTYRL